MLYYPFVVVVCHVSNKALDTFTDYTYLIEYGKKLIKRDKKNRPRQRETRPDISNSVAYG